MIFIFHCLLLFFHLILNNESLFFVVFLLIDKLFFKNLIKLISAKCFLSFLFLHFTGSLLWSFVNARASVNTYIKKLIDHLKDQKTYSSQIKHNNQKAHAHSFCAGLAYSIYIAPENNSRSVFKKKGLDYFKC